MDVDPEDLIAQPSRAGPLLDERVSRRRVSRAWNWHRSRMPRPGQLAVQPRDAPGRRPSAQLLDAKPPAAGGGINFDRRAHPPAQ
jgi:hypothetical protein